MNENILKYIKNEKDIARYKISLLDKRTNKSYKYRLLSIERDFVEYPFEKLNLKDLDELKDAMSLFKTDRKQFEQKFAKDIVSKTKIISKEQIKILQNKIKYYEDLYIYLLDFKIKEINLLQNEYIKSKFKKANKDISSIGIDSLSEMEGVHLSKKRARIQVLIYCLSRFIYHKIQDIKNAFDLDDISFVSYEKIRKEVDNLFIDIKYKIFKHYNDGINEVPLLINGTLGHNNFVNTIYPLINLMDKHPGNYSIKRLLSKDIDFFDENNSPINKKFIQRGLGIVTPMKRVGNESIKLLYLDLWTKNGISINVIMNKEFFNHMVGDDYFKTIPTMPVWTFNEVIDNKFLLREVLSLLSLDEASLVDEIDFDDPLVLNKINTMNKGRIFICPELSKIFIAATRSESEHIKESCVWIDLLIKEIKDDYKNIFDPTTLKNKERADRMIRVRELNG
jgi:hypothetical protein